MRETTGAGVYTATLELHALAQLCFVVGVSQTGPNRLPSLMVVPTLVWEVANPVLLLHCFPLSRKGQPQVPHGPIGIIQRAT